MKVRMVGWIVAPAAVMVAMGIWGPSGRVAGQSADIPQSRAWLLGPIPEGTGNVPSHSGCPGEPKLLRSCAQEKAKQFDPPRTPDGKPNFQGMWARTNGTGTDSRSAFILEEHEGNRAEQVPAGKSLIVDPPDGLIPYQPWAKAKREEIMKTYIDQVSNCLPPGVPRHFLAPGIYQIVQSPGYVIFVLEHAGHTRIVPTDGRAHIGGKTRLWQGDSVGHWEGNTLVVDTTNVNGQAFLSILPRDFTSANLHVVERYTLFDTDSIFFEATLEDPTVFTRPWTIAWGRTRMPGKNLELFEEACHEGNRSDTFSVPNLMFLGLDHSPKP
jgi:hypothetical protein